MHGINLHWLPENARWPEQLAALSKAEPDAAAWDALVALATARLSALQTMQLDRRRERLFPGTTPAGDPVRLAVLGSSTVDHLLPAIRVAGLRRGLPIRTFAPDYGQYAQELLDPAAGLHRFAPQVVVFALDAPHLLQGIAPEMAREAVDAALDRVLDRLEAQWRTARERFAAQVIQHIPLPVFLPLVGSNEHRAPGSPLAALRTLSDRLRARADAAGVDLLALDDRAAADGLTSWHDPALWHRAKQEIHPQAAPLYGDLIARLVAAARGRSGKCLVLDLDNTLWGGVIGDDGMAGIKLGQGSARGEAHLAFQRYARDLSRRGIILAVCSKNDEANALEPFDSHPEMLLRRSDIACFVANWSDKASNLRLIAQRLNIGLDSLVFADDNPAERAVVRRELPVVAVPELPDDPTLYARAIADGGYFEAVQITAEDGNRARLYQQNLQRESAQAVATDMDGYLRSLEMRAVWGPFDATSRARVTQLINKTNQFNLMTQRVSESDVEALMADRLALTLQIRLLDQFGDNGIIAIVAGRLDPATRSLRLDHWLMSCRVLGRGMEAETLNLVAAEARRLGATALIGEYRPTAKNEMVRDHYAKLGFEALPSNGGPGALWQLDLADFTPRPTFIRSEPAGTDARELTPA